MYKRIVVPLDGSKLAEEVLPHVRQVAHCMGSDIVLLRVTSFPYYDYALTDPGLSASLTMNMEDVARAYLQPLVQGLVADGFHATAEVVTVGGTVADAIIDFAREKQADLIAMSTHGRTGPSRWFLGSVADRVVRGAGMPVLLIRPVEES